MKKWIAIILTVLPTIAAGQGLVEIGNVPLPVEPGAILPSSLRSHHVAIVAEPEETKKAVVSFNDSQVRLLDVNWIVSEATKSGLCRVQIDINDKIAKVWVREPPVGVEIQQPPGGVEGAVEIEIQEPPGGIAGKWEPPGGIVFTPNDVLVLKVSSIDTKNNEKGRCALEFVVLGDARLSLAGG